MVTYRIQDEKQNGAYEARYGRGTRLSRALLQPKRYAFLGIKRLSSIFGTGRIVHVYQA